MNEHSMFDFMKDFGVSVIVPAKNEEEHIEGCIDSLLNQDYPGSLEVIVVDNLSNDNTYEIALKKGVHVVRSNGYAPSVVRNFGVSISSGEYVAFTDGDCIVPQNWISQSVLSLQDNKIGAIGGGCIAPENSNRIVKLWAPKPKAKNANIIKNRNLPGSNMVMRRRVFIDAGGFDESLISAEDDHLCKKIISLGYIVGYDEKLPVIHFGYPSSFNGIFRKSVWHGSTQLKAHGLFGDRLLSLTLVWILVFFSAIAAICLGSLKIFYSFFMVFMLLPLFLIFARLENVSIGSALLSFPWMYLICFTVLFGRAIGLIKEMIANSFITKALIK